ncbi:Telomeric repeat-binding factor 2 [Staphylococcus lugdunensis]|uniref:DUF4352 domain-containing protein n=1 Tax=Staphylococcus lugdunensis TaxID=28035 RepID=A0ABD4EEG8_STALU|nr:DUF4352 domain-containing protein [Staphylococcus lugdunensis]EFU83311.1 hypothetical protein HMPREF0790_2143 [Staphylococcus lugdunensis M23590]KXA37528.1 hypothetical protein HMPREF3225_01594 [Staphylococcus lugdunensis]SQE72698.1 Telomeric repeat-binding factor 2 [Staphylococcus lugdunensis]
MKDNFNEDQKRQQWEQFQEFQKQQEMQKNPKKRKGWLWGCGGCLVLLIIIIIGMSACTATFTGSSGSKNNNSNKTYKVGETAKNGDLEVTINSVENTKQVGPSVAPTNAKGTFVVVNVKVKNKGKDALTIDSNMFKLQSGDKSLEADASGSTSANQAENGEINHSFFLERVNPDSTAEGKIVFDVSDNIANAKDKKIEISSNLLSVKKVTFDLSNK